MAKRLHRLFAVNNETAECADCRVRFGIPATKHILVDSVYVPVKSVAERIAEITPDSQVIGYYRSYVGYCEAPQLVYVNTSSDKLDLSGLGLPSVGPGEIFMIGDKTPPKTVKKYAPQLVCIDNMQRLPTCELDLFPLTADELVRFTTHTGSLFYNATFVSPRS